MSGLRCLLRPPSVRYLISIYGEPEPVLRVRLHNGAPVVTDHRATNRFLLVDCESFDRATELAARVAAATSGVADVRPVCPVSAIGFDVPAERPRTEEMQ